MRFICVMACGCLLLPVACDDGAECNPLEWSCSEDGLTLTTCLDGQWQTENCQAAGNRLCDQGQCVEPWVYGSPTWSRAEDEPLATSDSLHEKAATYDDIVGRGNN